MASLSDVLIGMTHTWALARQRPGNASSHSWGTTCAAVTAGSPPNAAASTGRMNVQVTNSVCISQRMRYAPRSIRTWVDAASGIGKWRSRSSADKCARLASRSWASINITMWEMASGTAIVSGGRA